MAYSYKKMKNEDGTEQNNILAEKGMVIPKDPLNRHYQEYLAWVADGNTTQPHCRGKGTCDFSCLHVGSDF